ncbi:MAG: CHASE2 domain-containing protein [Motiliproteus sp.]|nr:CHASE2 domain-containing protein [Motiliproteus sp.]MCW9053811.1 CHASE2 domain-containing protein [Motiliproteus sp.]
MTLSRPRILRMLLALSLLILFMTGPGSDYSHRFSERFEQQLYDWRIRLNQQSEVDPRIVIIDIDEASLASVGHWPWPRETLAELINRLFDQYGIGLMAFDMFFPESDQILSRQRLEQVLSDAPSEQRQQLLQLVERLNPDQLMARSLTDRPVVLGYAFSPDGKFHAGELPPPLASAQSEQLNDQIRQAPGFSANLSVLQSQTPYGGFVDNPLLDSDGLYRQVPMLQRFQGQLYPALSLSVLQSIYGSQQVNLLSGGQYNLLETIDMDGLQIPVDAQAAMLVPYRGPQGSFPYISAQSVLSGEADISQLEGAIVLLGTSAAGLLDLRATPVQNAYPGVEVHANLIAAMLDDKMLHRPDYMHGANLVQCLLIGLLLVMLPPYLSALGSTLLAVSLASAVIVANLMLWKQAHHVLPLAPPLMILSLLYAVQLLLGYVVETRNRQHLSGLFGQYVPPELVDEMQHQQSDFGLGGENRQMTVLFSDIRSFTTLSEALTPQQLSHLLNTYLTPMTAIVHQHRGTIDKYIGDAMMAFWGAPLKDPDHSRHALQAALAMLDQLQEINQELEQQGLPPVHIGIGLNSGEMSVGNMGSRFRMAYTVLGDAVNLGSRLEGLTKAYGVSLIVSESVVEQVPDQTFRLLDRVQVKGKNEAVAIYEPLAESLEVEQHWLDEHQQAMESYRQRNWSLARSQFEKLLTSPLGPSPYQLYLDRLDYLERQPPADDWDGVYVFDHK